jgi:uncharacterized protein Yka (UPF0111/DUF47 family)
MKKTFQISDEIEEIKGYIVKAAKKVKPGDEHALSLIERCAWCLEALAKKVEEVEDRLDLLEEQSAGHKHEGKY